MIKFFRKIRQNLLSEGKIGKYFKYAIGEIVLVVLGILIAISINNWNEDRKSSGLEKNYLISLKEEFEFNIQNVEFNSNANKSKVNSCLEILQYTDPNELKIKKVYFDSLLSSIFYYETQLEPKNETIYELISSGKLSIINNSNLRTSLYYWSNEIKGIEKREEEFIIYKNKLLNLIMKKNLREAYSNSNFHQCCIGQSRFKNHNLELLKSIEFESSLTQYLVAAKNNQISYDIHYNTVEEILTMIKKELKE